MGSWALALLHERITSTETPIVKASSQLRRVCQELPVRPISLWDSEYGNAVFVNETADIPADKIVPCGPTSACGVLHHRIQDTVGRGSTGISSS